jgi:hypothetical protein
MTEQQVTLDELRERRLEDVLREVADQQARMAVLLPDGREVVIEPKIALKPLPELEGRVPAGWKDVLYARG